MAAYPRNAIRDAHVAATASRGGAVWRFFRAYVRSFRMVSMRSAASLLGFNSGWN
jgi:hypothetical protein